MPNSTYLPSRDADFALWTNQFEAYISANAALIGLLPAQVSAFSALNATWTAALATATAKVTRTEGSIEAKNAAKAELIDGPNGIRQLVDIIQAFPGTTDTMRVDMGITVRDVEPTPVPPPEFAPVLSVQMSIGRVVKLRLRDAENADRRGKPDGTDGATVLMFVGENPPQSALQWSMLFNTSKTLVDIDLPDTIEPGTRVWFSAFWFNQRKESGPTAEPVSVRTADGLKAAA